MEENAEYEFVCEKIEDNGNKKHHKSDKPEENTENEKVMRVLYVAPGEKPVVKKIVHTLENLQKEVGGLIEAFYPFNDEVAVICNDEGKINGMNPNRAILDEKGVVTDIIFGPFLVVGLTSDDFCGLNDELLKKYKAMFKSPELFLKQNDTIMVLAV